MSAYNLSVVMGPCIFRPKKYSINDLMNSPRLAHLLFYLIKDPSKLEWNKMRMQDYRAKILWWFKILIFQIESLYLNEDNNFAEPQLKKKRFGTVSDLIHIRWHFPKPIISTIPIIPFVDFE